MTTHRIDLTATTPPLNANQRLHWAQKAKLTRALRQEVGLRARSQALHKETTGHHLTVQLHYRPRDNRRRDRGNLYPTYKACLDGLIDAGLAPDDTPQYVTETVPQIHPAEKGKPGTLWLTIVPEP